MKQAPLRVGFDLDGVILYNPARIIRPIVAAVKRKLLKKKKLKFYVPQSPQERFIWRLFHKSSLFIAPGFSEIRPLVDSRKIEAYIVTARYDFLKEDFHSWLRKSGCQEYFHGWFHNKDDEQPHLYKEAMVRKLGLDIFIEDNLDIVRHLAKSFPDKHIIWIYNLLDSAVDYPHRFPHLRRAMEFVKKIANER
ncbi:MAG: hypothetical protein N2691_02515 [Patescibacteria group bacterium]|nr:hypothetical protein [Patescibacteria group bacterium]